jgi:alpha-tubulin suppressor-like RCC1 family protein
MYIRALSTLLLTSFVLLGHAAPRIAAGEGGSYYIKSDHTLLVWGDYYEEPSNNRTPPVVAKPIAFAGLSNVTSVSAGEGHALALKEDGTVWAWGYNGDGQLGNGYSNDGTEVTPVRVRGVSGIVAIVAGFQHSLALGPDGTVWAWGNNSSGQLGDGTNIKRGDAGQIQRLSDVVAIAAGMFHTLALKKDGSVWAWGNNEDGELGDGTRTDRLRPVQVNGLTHIKAIAAGYHNSIALKDDGTVWAWGGDRRTKQASTKPRRVRGLENISAISSAGWYSLFLGSHGEVWAWGSIASGEEDEPAIDVDTPTKVTGLSDITEVAAGLWHSLALKRDGAIFAWGRNYNGALGDGSTDGHANPRKVDIDFAN